VIQDTSAVQETYDSFVIDYCPENFQEITENALGKLNFKKITFHSGCSSLERIHSNAFAHQSKTTSLLSIEAMNVTSGPSPYSFYDMVNSFEKLEELTYWSQIETLEEKFGPNLNNLIKISLRLNAIKGSPFSNMSRIRNMELENGNLDEIQSGNFKIGSLRNKSIDGQLDINLKFNKLNGSSFKKGTFTDSSFKNLDVTLDFLSNEIDYLDEAVFFTFLNEYKGTISTLNRNPLDCDDCRSAWICRSNTSDEVRDAIRMSLCENGHFMTDCEKSFRKCKS